MFLDKGMAVKFIVIVLILLVLVGAFFHFNRDMFVEDNSSTAFEDIVNDEVRVHFIDVGQGDCALIQSQSGNILIDAGTPDSKDDILNYIDSLGISEFEYAIFTHPHSDHIGSASDIIDKYVFKNVILPDAVSSTKLYEELLDTLEKEKCNVILGEAGKTFSVGNATMELFAPSSYYYPDDLNDMSIVSKFTYGEISFLFTGDAEKFSEKEILEHGSDISADVLKVGHHGSNTSSHKNFLNAVDPSVAVISAGKNNEYGHPHDEVVERLENIQADMYITYEVGSVIVSTDGSSYKISTTK